MGDCHHHDCCEPRDCCEPKDCCESRDCCYRPQYGSSCGGQDNSIWLIILVVIILCLFCGGNDNKGGLFGGLF